MKRIIKFIYKIRYIRWQLYLALHDGYLNNEQWDHFNNAKKEAK